MMSVGDMIDVQDIPEYLRAGAQHPEQAVTPLTPSVGSLEEQERVLLIRALEEAAGNQSKAARILRIGRDALRYKLKKHNLETTDSGRASAAAG